jgi:hypothetical protein
MGNKLKQLRHMSLTGTAAKYDQTAVGNQHLPLFDDLSLDEKRTILRGCRHGNRIDLYIENWLRAHYSTECEQEQNQNQEQATNNI